MQKVIFGVVVSVVLSSQPELALLLMLVNAGIEYYRSRQAQQGNSFVAPGAAFVA